ncbi:MAG: ROK family protein [Bacteroidales bacterium]|nr:ROK family protein [Bacteroidales bacterium]
MATLGIDLGGTKISSILFTEKGDVLEKKAVTLNQRKGPEVGALITEQIIHMKEFSLSHGDSIKSIGISVPGISCSKTGLVWAPNIPGWENYPLLDDIRTVSGNIAVTIESDRTCHLLGELWMGNAKGCSNVVFLAVGTGIGAGILVNGEVLRGSNDIAGSIGWMALDRPFHENYTSCGCFEYHASGEGIAKVTRQYLRHDDKYRGELAYKEPEEITSYDVLNAYNNGDPLANKVIGECIEFWGMATANLVSIFNPEKIIFGGGLFGPAASLLPDIKNEAEKWAQPVSIRQVILDTSALEGDAGVYGAGYIALENLSEKKYDLGDV